METIVKINWDKPEEQDWLCDGNVSIALHSYCKNTKFDVTELKEMTASEAIFGFSAWLTSRKEKIVLSSRHNASPIAELIREFCEVNKLNDPRGNWTDYLTHPST